MFFQKAGGLSAVPRDGGAPRVVAASTAPGFLMVDDANVYGVTGGSAIVSVPKAGGAVATLYTAPKGQSIRNFTLDAGTLYWTEEASDILHPSGQTLRSAPVAATLVPTTIATLAHADSADVIVAHAGTVAYVTIGSLANTFGTLQAVAAGGAPKKLADRAAPPLVAANATVYFDDGSGIGKVGFDGGGASHITTPGLNGLAVDPNGVAYYAAGRCIAKAQ